jgi:hypothetical protein
LLPNEKDALCQESIAIENPMWVLEIGLSIIQSQRVVALEAAWNDLDFFNPTWMPLSIASKFEQLHEPTNDDANGITHVS